MKKTGVSTSGVFTIKEYLMDDQTTIPELIRMLEAGPGEIQEVISYVFDGEDPLKLDARSFDVEEFLKMYPQMESYGSGLAFDVVMQTGGQPLTVELTQGEQTVSINSLDKEVELEDLLGGPKQEEMSPQELLDILAVAEKLKCNTRHCDTSNGRRESVAEHSWRAALTAMLLSGIEEYKDYDMDRVIRMCLIHDLGEACTGDIPTFAKTSDDEKKEISELEKWVRSFPEAQKKEFMALYAEMEALSTPEAKLYKAIDKIEAVIQHNESDIRSWLPLEYDLQMTYGQEEAAFSPWLRKLRELVDQWTKEKIAAGSKE